jgi:Cysteine-rich secretory protein family/S-layer homology domain
VVAAVAPAPAAEAAISAASFESCLLNKINDARADAGVRTLTMASDITDGVRDWSEWMSNNSFQHTSSAKRKEILPDGAFTNGENIAWRWDPAQVDCSQIHQMFMNSSGHRANILNSSWRYVGLGAYVESDGTWWVTEIFFDATNYSPVCEGTFCDDDGSIFEPDIEWMASAGITMGCNPPTNNRYCPNDYVTRGQMAAFLSRALDLTNRGSIDFRDDDGSTFEADIERLAAAGITVGCNPPANDRFCPDSRVTRAQMAAFLSRALDLTNRGSIDFRDDDGSMFEADIEKIAAAGITMGCNPPTNSMFCPDDYLTRAQMAAFLSRADL